MRLLNPGLSRHELGAVAISVMAVGGLVGVIGVLLGLQCGGLDKCFFHEAEDMVAAVEPAEAAPVPEIEEARLAPQPLAIAEAATATETAEAPDDGIQQVIGGSFAALNANDEAWLKSARKAAAAENPAATAVAATSDDGATPEAIAASPAGGNGETAAQAVAAIAETPVVPLDRPEPLEVSAYARTPSTAPQVKEDAEQRLAAAAEAKQAKAEPKAQKVAEAEAPAAAGDMRTVTGEGVNVRSGPGKSNGRLFALAAGEKVKVVEDRRGWLKITDDQNRTGWVYQSYLR